jgi:peroxiredoxin (alkyl hydroperoxide reductase subunit C)
MMGVLVGKKAPEFSVQAIVDGTTIQQFSLSDFKEKIVVLLFYPLDFTFVCPTELHAFQDRLNEFESKNTVVVGCSVDSVYSHLAWLQTPKSKGGIEGVTYTLLSDLNKDVARSYGVLNESGVSYRGLFLIDGSGTVRHQVVNDLPLGRSVDEALRMVDSLIFHENHGQVCPANWTVGKRGMKPTHEGLKAFMS